MHRVPRLRTTVGAIALTVLTAGSAAVASTALSAAATADQAAVRAGRHVIGPVPPPTTTPYRLPVADADRAAWADTHAAYPATDIFVGCGAELVAPVNGTVLEVRRVDDYDRAVDNPATRGGKSVSILGADGVRYYLAHFASIVEPLDVGDNVAIGRTLGTMGDTGRASACHLHFAISPPCPGKEWSIRRGVIWPSEYLDAWRRGEQRSPAGEVAAWSAANPTACADAIADPFAPDA